MKELIKITRGIGKVILALLGAILMPILIWIALGVAINKKLREKEVPQMETETISELLAKADQTVKK